MGVGGLWIIIERERWLKKKHATFLFVVGLHDYRATIELRTFHQTLWSQQFSGLHCRRHDLALGAARFTLIRHDSTVDHTPLEKSLSLPWRTELFKGSVAVGPANSFNWNPLFSY